MESKRNSTPNLAVHLSKHDITKHSTPNSTSTIVDTTSKLKISLEQLVINWVVNSLAPFNAIKHPNFQTMFKAYSCKYAIQCTNTVYNCIIEQAIYSLEALRAKTKLYYLTILLRQISNRRFSRLPSGRRKRVQRVALQ
jgi:hypothetical protein